MCVLEIIKHCDWYVELEHFYLRSVTTNNKQVILKKKTNIDESQHTDLRARSQDGVSAICGLVGGHIYCCCSLCISYVSLGKGAERIGNRRIIQPYSTTINN